MTQLILLVFVDEGVHFGQDTNTQRRFAPMLDQRGQISTDHKHSFFTIRHTTPRGFALAPPRSSKLKRPHP